MPDHPPPSFASDEPPHLDSRDVRAPIDPGDALHAAARSFAADLIRLAREEGYAAGLASGLDRGRRQAQTEVDGLTYERGVSDERGRIIAIVKGARTLHVRAEILAAIRSGEPAPKPGT